MSTEIIDALIDKFTQNSSDGLAKLNELLAGDKSYFSDNSYAFLAALAANEVAEADKAAEALMEANPAMYESSVCKVAGACQNIRAKFSLLRAVFRRFPGRYRQQLLEVSRELCRGDNGESADLIKWMIWKFGGEIVPELISFINGSAPASIRAEVLAESARCLGKSAMPLILAAASSEEPELSNSATECLRRLGM
ncbi:MAG: hypothetical protein K6G50_09775 [bacterium]|nr:hypothetical protein [bacterium]